MIRSYELGVLILDPERVKLPYDYPVAKYGVADKPWICDVSYTEADSHGRQWIMCSSLFRGSGDVEKDRKILSYGDVVLYTSDLYTLNPGMWLNDNIITFACEYLLSKATQEVREQVAIVSAASCELIRYSGDMEIIRDIFFSLGFFKKEKVFSTLLSRHYFSLSSCISHPVYICTVVKGASME
ncbi:hypothetical protein COOONC_28139 [Cooperia oncophora]